MDNKRFKMFIGITIIVVILACVGYYIVKRLQDNKEAYFEEYTPQEEISDTQMRNTIVKLYFTSSNSTSLVAENKSIDSKELMQNPYSALVNMLIAGPTDSSLSKTIPDGTKLNSASFSKGCVVLDFSAEFVDNHPGGVNAESNTIYSIVNTLTELNEVSSVKILIDGKAGLCFNDNALNFTEAFVRKQ